MFMVNNTWMLVAVFPVFIMYLGFATVESGLTRAKNNANILFKNTAFVSMGLLTYAIIGFKPDVSGKFLYWRVFRLFRIQSFYTRRGSRVNHLFGNTQWCGP
ncbi:MAG: hypothetical protein ACHQ6U_03445 [Thermodesulfobacteriota bacterium]